MEIEGILRERIHKSEILRLVQWSSMDIANFNRLMMYATSKNDRISINALWTISCMPKSCGGWIQSQIGHFINILLKESHPSKKRILLQILRERSYDRNSLPTDFLDFCLSKINSQWEPYAVRAFCIHCAFKMCRLYPELIQELNYNLDMLSSQELSPGLRSALNNTRKAIQKLSAGPRSGPYNPKN